MKRLYKAIMQSQLPPTDFLNRKPIMPLPMKPIKDNPKLTKLLKASAIAYEKMTPEQKRKMWAAQRKSWVIGNMMLSNPDMTKEYVEKIYDEITMKEA